ncbi:thioredoxin domain-containing protein [Rhodocyclus tenuis]|uniref:thioredoxin domain-containing protein n=1 Tax=Rhodocyclus tenuis TaxID=1066 RepID=UPI00190460AC|nr:thioredoxin domain-containing protein [Rhodocyclus tenuis]MBK1681650.1 hypothetical protein [Rhodocyclus tenuis]
MSKRLSRETSPYLRQHADNPVDWHPWNAAALALARAEDRPILLSIGYSACHWCHVMAHESFADEATAALMNAHFVNIKVDREERPDLDQIYQTAHQMLTGRAGGWPLTLFLTPAGVPFFGGTYFPPAPRHGLPAFGELLLAVADAWQQRRGEIEAQNRELTRALAQTVSKGATAAADFVSDPLALAVAELAANFDAQDGGFGPAPKFPHANDLDLLLRVGTPEALTMATTTLTRMAEGGLFDQIGGGFCRYSVDERWEIPHFEKMLYDNAQLLRVYADAWTLTGDARYRDVVEATAAWVLREMQSPSGAYYASLDADSEGGEGAFYVWQRAEFAAALSATEAAVASAHWGLDAPANFTDEEGQRRWHLTVARPLGEVAAAQGLSPAKCRELLAAAREKLFAVRSRRPPPARDEKILAGWNALMIEGMAHAGRVCGRPDWVDSARRALACVRRELWRDGRLYASCRDDATALVSGTAPAPDAAASQAPNKAGLLNAYLDDHAFLLAAILELLQDEFVASDLDFAVDLADELVDAFADVGMPPAAQVAVVADSGNPYRGFFFTRHDHEPLIHRPKPGHDNATPSGNAVAARALLRLGQVTGETRWQAAVEGVVSLFHNEATRSPAGFASWLMALEEFRQPPRRVVLRGPQTGFAPWKSALGSRYLDDLMVVFLRNGERDLPPPLRLPESDHVNAWVCTRVTCLPPVSTPESLIKELFKAGELK